MLVVEVGGTYIRAADFNLSANSLNQPKRADSPNYLIGGDRSTGGLEDELVEAIHRLSRTVTSDGRSSTIGVAFPGPITPLGEALAAPTLSGSALGSDIPSKLRQLWGGSDVYILNDLTAAGYRLVANGKRDFCVLTVGSGIGNKVFIGGRPLVGDHGRGGELGHLKLDCSPDALRCDCGDVGHVGGIASGRGAAAAARHLSLENPDQYRRSVLAVTCPDPQHISERDLVSAFLVEDDWARYCLRYGMSFLGQALAAIHVSIGIEEFVLLGGFARALGEPYRLLLAEIAESMCWRIGQNWDQIIQLGPDDDNSALLGLGFYLREQLTKRNRTPLPDHSS